MPTFAFSGAWPGEIGIALVIEKALPGERVQRLTRGHSRQIQCLFRGADAAIGPFQHRQIGVFLIAEIVIDHPLGAACRLGDAFQPGTAIAVTGELGQGRLQ